MNKKKLLIIGTVWPEPNSSAAGKRMVQIINLFDAEKWERCFASSSSKSDFSVDFMALGVSEEQIKLNDASFDEFIKSMNPDLVIFDRFMIEEQFGWRVAEHCPKAVRVLDTEDLHFLRKAREVAFKEEKNVLNPDLVNETTFREMAAIYRSDLNLIISNAEMEILKTKFDMKANFLHYLPFLLNENEIQGPNHFPSFEERAHFVSIGNFLHPPNWDSVQYLKQEAWPLINAKLPDVEMHVYGAYPSQKVLELHDKKSGFLVKGRAESSEGVIQNARVLLAPLRFGAGLKGKLFEAMIYGTPSITTSIGAEGMSDDLQWNGHIKNTPQEFADAAIQLYQNKKEWQTAQVLGFELLREKFLESDFRNHFREKIEWLFQNLEQHRKTNFIGNLLQKEAFSSTKYMSRWIEEKNKKS